jgi:hypothetical protein
MGSHSGGTTAIIGFATADLVAALTAWATATATRTTALRSRIVREYSGGAHDGSPPCVRARRPALHGWRSSELSSHLTARRVRDSRHSTRNWSHVQSETPTSCETRPRRPAIHSLTLGHGGSGRLQAPPTRRAGIRPNTEPLQQAHRERYPSLLRDAHAPVSETDPKSPAGLAESARKGSTAAITPRPDRLG